MRVTLSSGIIFPLRGITNDQFPMSNQNTIHKTPYTKHILLITLFLIAFLERTAFDLGANIELVTMAMILASFYLGRKEAFWLILAIMTTTDRVIGNTSILLFTWSGFLIPALLSKNLINRLTRLTDLYSYKAKITKTISLLFPTISTGLASNLFFFLWTNFGVWLLDTWSMYPKTLQGIVMSYINGLPFLRNQFISSLIFIPLGIIAIEVSKLLHKKYVSSFAKLYQKHTTS